jgi:DNA replication protein DnaC
MSTENSTVLLGHHLKKLKLSTIWREHEKVAALCRTERTDYPQYLFRLAELELLDREVRSKERRIRDAGFPVVKTIETFDFKAQPSINHELFRGLMRGDYIDKKENVLLVGNSGTGKTHLATALAYQACCQGRAVRFFSATSLVTQLLENREEKQLSKFHRQLARLQMIVVDTKFCPFSQGPFRSPRVLRISPNRSSVLKIASRVSSRLLQPGLAQAAEIASHAA